MTAPFQSGLHRAQLEFPGSRRVIPPGHCPPVRPLRTGLTRSISSPPIRACGDSFGGQEAAMQRRFRARAPTTAGRLRLLVAGVVADGAKGGSAVGEDAE